MADFEAEDSGHANPPVTWKLGIQCMSDKNSPSLPSTVAFGSFGPSIVPESAQGASNGTICVLASPSALEGQTGSLPSYEVMVTIPCPSAQDSPGLDGFQHSRRKEPLPLDLGCWQVKKGFPVNESFHQRTV